MIFTALLAVALLQPPAETYSLRAVVSDAKGVPLRDLEAADVSLIEGGVTRSISRFEKDERPARVALLIDSSQPLGTAYRLHFIDAAKALVASFPPSTWLTVWTTGDRPSKVVDDLNLDSEGSSKEVESRLKRVAPTGANRILDALVEAAEDLEKKEGERKILVFISGTGPGFANEHRQGIVDRVLKKDMEVTGVVIAEGGESDGGGDVTRDDYDYVFSNLAQSTGGKLERTLSVMGTETAGGRVAADLRATYRVTYLQPSGSRRSKIELQVARPAVKARLSKPRKETPSP